MPQLFWSISNKSLKFGEERSRLQEKLDMEAMERAEADEARQRIAARKVRIARHLSVLRVLIGVQRLHCSCIQVELEASLDQLEKQLGVEEQRREAAERDRKKLLVYCLR